MFIKFNKFISKAVVSLALAAAVTGCSKTVEPVSVMNTDKIALEGYDTVAYFISGEAAKADGSFSHDYKGVQWHFENEQNLERFKADPESFIPEYGGWCAYDLAEGELVKADPKQWHIHNKRLYLFNDEDAKKEWFIQMVSVLPSADKAYETIMNPVEESEQE